VPPAKKAVTPTKAGMIEKDEGMTVVVVGMMIPDLFNWLYGMYKSDRDLIKGEVPAR